MNDLLGKQTNNVNCTPRPSPQNIANYNFLSNTKPIPEVAHAVNHITSTMTWLPYSGPRRPARTQTKDGIRCLVHGSGFVSFIRSQSNCNAKWLPLPLMVNILFHEETPNDGGYNVERPRQGQQRNSQGHRDDGHPTSWREPTRMRTGRKQ